MADCLVIETERLRLRPFGEADLDDLARLNANPSVMRYLGAGRPLSRGESWRQIALMLGHTQLRGYSLLAIEDRASGAFVGRSGPWYPEGWPMLEVGWVVDPHFQGQGIATEAGRASLDWCFANLDVEQVCSVIHPANGASARVAELGARLERLIDDGSFAVPANLWVYDRPTVRPARRRSAGKPQISSALPNRLQIETSRLRLRPFRQGDLDDLARLYADPEVMRYVGCGRTKNRAQTWREIAIFLGHLAMRGYTTLAIEQRETLGFLGECGLWFPEDWPMLEVGWVVDPRCQTQGIATEAGRAALDWCRANLAAEQVCSIIHPDNFASARVAQKLGARIARRLEEFEGTPADLWVHRR